MHPSPTLPFRCLLLTFALILVRVGVVSAQDALFSQYSFAPLAINPAWAGHFEGKFRAAVVYRTQYANATPNGGYTTPSASLDFNLLDDKMRGSLGAGVTFINDRSIGGKVNHLSGLVSVAYHFAFEEEEEHNFLSVGIQGGLVSRTLRTGELTFASQFDGDNFNSTINSGENITANNFSAPDLSAGIAFANYFNGGSNVRFGLSARHLLPASDGFIDNSTAKTAMMLVGTAEMTYQVSEHFSLRPNVLFAQQVGGNYIQAGALVGVHFNPSTALLVGGGYRVGDGALAQLQIHLGQIRIGAAYDFNSSPLATLSQGQGGWEVALSLTTGKGGKMKAVLPAFRFY